MPHDHPILALVLIWTAAAVWVGCALGLGLAVRAMWRSGEWVDWPLPPCDRCWRNPE